MQLLASDAGQWIVIADAKIVWRPFASVSHGMRAGVWGAGVEQFVVV